ncbi:MAG: hypothetical protein KDD60_00320 [Bdellovibrionales bacterium]|nr:hypothetical protein [Bdellovibrionales bacterium]
MKFTSFATAAALSVLLFLGIPLAAFSQDQTLQDYNITDPFDPNDFPFQADSPQLDELKTSEELISEAEMLFLDDRPLDGRTKLLLALKKDPENYRAHSMLAGYYIVHVGHYRLALRYIRKAQELFEKQYGPPPYSDYELQNVHSHHLHLLSQARLNLDDYPGALKALDEYESYGYYKDWYPGSRAWVLMKNGNLNEAIKVARLGLLAGAEPGRTLNILGILLSMTGQREQSLEVFRQAISHEFSLGSYGQPATPLNNIGEVYREIFQEDAAEKSWLKATSLPDGCEHVLPSLNLATIQLERLDLSRAKRAIDEFETCVAQFPLRNGEEHRALVHLARGRILTQAGQLDKGIEHFREAKKRTQWFGKIGTDEEDLTAGVLSSLALALEQKSTREELFPTPKDLSIYARTLRWIQRMQDSVESWWLRRRTLQLLMRKLNWGEDLYVRNTDSLLEYGYLGSLLSLMPAQTLEKRLRIERDSDGRGNAENYYEAYLGENYLKNGRFNEGVQTLETLISRLRLPPDAALKAHVELRLASRLSPKSKEYRHLSEDAFLLNRPSLPSYGVRLSVNYSGPDDRFLRILDDSPFLVDNSYQSDFLLTSGLEGESFSLRFTSRTGRTPVFTVSGDNISTVISKLAEEVFQIEP